MNNPAKQDNIVHKFDGVWVFTSSLDVGHLGSGVAGKINSMIAKAVNESSFVILGGDFNEDGFHKSASFKKRFNLGLVNSLGGSLMRKSLTWCNLRGVTKTIDYVFVSSNLVNAIMGCDMMSVDDFFDTNHRPVLVSVGLGGLLDCEFKVSITANTAMFSDVFSSAMRFSDLDAIWDTVCKIVVLSANRTFKKKWFKDFDNVYNKESSKFHKLELLVSKLVKASYLVSSADFVFLLERWNDLDSFGVLAVKYLFLLGSSFDSIWSALAKTRKLYHSFKLSEFRHTKESHIRLAINKRIESFELNKNYIIRSVLECFFCKVVLDHLVVDDELILEPNLVKSKLLDYVFNDAFSGVMCSISFDKMFAVVKDLLNGKTAGLSGISNELWKHCNKSVLDMLLVLLNFCLSPIFAIGSVVENALKKSRELWLVLQDMHKAYDLVGWEHLKRNLVRIKMCDNVAASFSGLPLVVGPISSDVLQSCKFDVIGNSLLCVGAARLSVFTDRSLSGLSTSDMRAGTAAYFENIDLGLGVEMSGLVFSMMMELQVITLALECILFFCLVNLFSDSQAALDACRSESSLFHPNFRNRCWIEHHHIINVIRHKNLDVNWIKVKDHSGVLGYEHANALAKTAVSSGKHLPHIVNGYFLVADGTAVSGNSRHFLLYTCASNVDISVALCKGFVFRDWFNESVAILKDPKAVSICIVNFVCKLCAMFCEEVWLVHTKYRVFIEKKRLIPSNSSILSLVSGLSSRLFAGVVRLLNVADACGIGFGFRKSC
ncbi:hypothetical protein G9A89_006239 [Geosiphon pyriformis]|nr:hypothetical protein G9A89_006239 [Geosiphon pyriformis]